MPFGNRLRISVLSLLTGLPLSSLFAQSSGTSQPPQTSKQSRNAPSSSAIPDYRSVHCEGALNAQCMEYRTCLETLSPGAAYLWQGREKERANVHCDPPGATVGRSALYGNSVNGAALLNLFQNLYTPKTGGPNEITSSGAPLPELPTAPLIDPATFAAAGTDQISQSMDSVLNDCPAAIQYVEGPLLHDLDVAMSKHSAHKAGLDLLQQTRGDLLSDTWWARSSGPEIASRIKYVTDEVQDIIGALSPGAAEISAGKDALLKALDVGAMAIKEAYENRQSVSAAAKAAAETAKKELMQMTLEGALKEEGFAQAASIIKIMLDYQERLKTMKEGAEFRDAVQEQLRKLDEQISALTNKISDDVAREIAINEIHDSVISVCSPPNSVPIGNSPKN